MIDGALRHTKAPRVGGSNCGQPSKFYTFGVIVHSVKKKCSNVIKYWGNMGG